MDATNPTSNSNYGGAAISENCPPSGINNALRAVGVMMARELAFQAAAISASVSTNLVTASTGLLVPVTGANAIASFGVVPGEQPSAAVLRFVQFSSSASLSNGTALRLLGNASRRTQPGDIGGYLHVGSSDVWHEFLYSRADGALAADSVSVTTITNRSLSTSAISTVTLNAASASITAIGITALNSLNSVSASIVTATRINASGMSILLGQATNVTYTTCGTLLPHDNSIPQIGEGDEVLSITVTPRNASSTLHIDVSLPVVGTAAAGGQVGAALFVDATANAIAAGTQRVGGTASTANIYFKHLVTAGSTTARTYRVRVGSETVSDAFLNGDSSARQFGGVSTAAITVTEVLP